jgi:hypothetical protein
VILWLQQQEYSMGLFLVPMKIYRVFFNRSGAIQEVLNKKNKPYSGIPVPVNAKLNGKWQVCQIVTAPFRWVLVIVLKAVAAGFKCCGPSQIAKHLKNCSKHLKIGFEICSEEATKLFKITNSQNSPNREGKIVQRHPPIPESRVTPSLIYRTFCPIHHEINFNHGSGGICRGLSSWFLNLFLKTKNQFNDPRSHMAALGKQFKNGGGMDPVLLQNIYLHTGDLLNLKIGTQPADANRLPITPEQIRNMPAGTYDVPIELIQSTLSQWRSNSEMIHQLRNIPTGAYAVSLPFHSVAFVKINDALGYYFDPNHGIIEIQGNELAEKLYEQVCISSNECEEAGNTDTSRERVSFTPVTLRT